jgi:hypothetical protein
MLHGCVTFEIEWSNVRGIHYVNELQVFSLTVSSSLVVNCKRSVCGYGIFCVFLYYWTGDVQALTMFSFNITMFSTSLLWFICI